MGEFHEGAARHINSPKLILAVTRRNERESLAVWRPARRCGRMLVVGQLTHFTAADRHEINLSRAFVGSFVHIGNCKSDEIALWRDLRIADAAYFQKIIDRESSLLRKRQRDDREQRNNQDCKESFHEPTS